MATLLPASLSVKTLEQRTRVPFQGVDTTGKTMSLRILIPKLSRRSVRSRRWLLALHLTHETERLRILALTTAPEIAAVAHIRTKQRVRL